MRFAGFGNEEDEWVSVKRGIRERSIPLEPSECDRLNVGDLVMCFRVSFISPNLLKNNNSPLHTIDVMKFMIFDVMFKRGIWIYVHFIKLCFKFTGR